MVSKYLEIILDVVFVALDIHKDPDLRFKMIEILHFLVDETQKSSANTLQEGQDYDSSQGASDSWRVDGVGEKILKDIVGTGLI